MINRIIDQLQQSHKILVVSHSHPDGDAVGSLLATGLALKMLNKDVTMYNESPIPAVYRFLPSVNEIQQQIKTGVVFDSIVVLDCGDMERIGTAADQIKQAPMVINIDHHLTNIGFGHLNLVDPEACATAEIVHRLIHKLSVSIDTAIATAIYTGILTDTGSFRFSNANHAAFAICAEMIAYGASPNKVARHVFGTYSLGRIKLLNLALDSLTISSNGKLSVMTLTQNMMTETKTQAEDADGIINYARRIEDVKVAALIHEVNNNGSSRSSFHVSLRSDGSVNVADIAAQFGGGGHASASGFCIQGTLTEIKSRILGLSETIFNSCATNSTE